MLNFVKRVVRNLLPPILIVVIKKLKENTLYLNYLLPPFILKGLMRVGACRLSVFIYTHRMYIPKSLNRVIVHFLSARHLIHPLKTQLKSGDLKRGISFLKKKYPLVKPRAVRFLIVLYQYLLNVECSLFSTLANNKNQKVKKRFIVHFCCWGESYSQKARDYLLPSLLGKLNLPEVSKAHDIVLLIHCDAKTKVMFENAKVLQHIQKYAALKMVVLPELLFKLYQSITHYSHFLFFEEVNRVNYGLKYLLLGALQGHALSEGIKHGALVSFLIPDSIVSDAFLSCAVSKIKNKKLVLTTTFRTDYHGVRERLEQFYTNEDKTICSVSGSDLSKLQVEFLHNTDRRRVISEGTNHFLACARFIFKTDNGLILRALHYHPVLIDCSKVKNDLKIDYFPIDDAVMKQVLTDQLSYEDQSWLCSDPAKMNFMELSGHDPEVNEPPVYVAPSTYDSLINSIYLLLKAVPKDLDEKLNRFFIRNELEFVASTQCHEKSEVIDHRAFISDLYKRVDGTLS